MVSALGRSDLSPRSPTDYLSVWAWFRKRPHQRSQDSNLAVRPRRETVMTLTVRHGTMWPSNSHQSQTGVSSVWQTPLWNKLIFHQMKEQTFLSCYVKQGKHVVRCLLPGLFSLSRRKQSFFYSTSQQYVFSDHFRKETRLSTAAFCCINQILKEAVSP